jgi:hypothetical protein
MNYGELVTAIQSYTENQFPTVYLADGSTEDSITQINRFIEQAEQRIYNSVQFPSLRKNMTGNLTAYNVNTNPQAMYLSAPNDFLSAYSLAVISPTTGEYTYLLNKDVNFIREAYPSPASTGIPKYYALFGPTVANGVISNELSFMVGPTPDLTYPVELHYYYYPSSISAGSASLTTTWLGDNFDTVLLYGCLVEAYTYMKGEQDIITLYDTKYKEALALAKRLGDGLERSDAYRSGQYREAPLPQNNGVR